MNEARKRDNQYRALLVVDQKHGAMSGFAAELNLDCFLPDCEPTARQRLFHLKHQKQSNIAYCTPKLRVGTGMYESKTGGVRKVVSHTVVVKVKLRQGHHPTRHDLRVILRGDFHSPSPIAPVVRQSTGKIDWHKLNHQVILHYE